MHCQPHIIFNTKCVLQGILIHDLSLKLVRTCPFQYSPHMLDSTNINNPLILCCSLFLGDRFTILKEDPALYPHTGLRPNYMRTVVTKWAMQCLASGSMLQTVESIRQFVYVLNIHSHREVLSFENPYKHKNMSISTLVSLSQLANLKNNFPTRKQITFE